jgi:hemolysin III
LSKVQHRYWNIEEIFNSATHGFALALSAVGMVILVILAARYGSAWHIVSCAIYGTSLLLLYTTSTLYHASRRPKARKVLRALDHASIYVLIAGTYTPFVLVNLRGGWGWTLFGLVWGLALGGIVFKAFFAGRFNVISLAVYLGMGWLVAIAIHPLVRAVPDLGLLFLLLGGLAYSLGTIFYATDAKPFRHLVWHCFVLAGSVFHYFAIMVSVLPSRA